MYEQVIKNDWQDGGLRIRYSKETPELPLLNNTCWQCSISQLNISQIIEKLEASLHQENNTAMKRSWTRILDRARRRVDLLGQTNRDMPTYLPNNTFPSMSIRIGRGFGICWWFIGRRMPGSWMLILRIPCVKTMSNQTTSWLHE